MHGSISFASFTLGRDPGTIYEDDHTIRFESVDDLAVQVEKHPYAGSWYGILAGRSDNMGMDNREREDATERDETQVTWQSAVQWIVHMLDTYRGQFRSADLTVDTDEQMAYLQTRTEAGCKNLTYRLERGSSVSRLL